MVVPVSEGQEARQPILEAEKNLHAYFSPQHQPLTTKQETCYMEEWQKVNEAIKRGDKVLAKNYVEVLCTNINRTTALPVLLQTNLVQDFEPCTPSAPPPSDDYQGTKENHNEDWVKDLQDNLRNRCLSEIDQNADFVLENNQLLQIGRQQLLDILMRDTFKASDELLVHCGVMKWAIEYQKKMAEKGFDVSLSSSLGDLKYAPRYGLLSKEEFLTRTIDGIPGPDRSGILTEDEIDNILTYIKNKNKKNVRELPFKGSQPRKSRDSAKSKAVKSTGEKHLLNFLTCWSAVFD